MMRSSFFVLTAGAIVLSPALAHAQDEEDCPPGGWFCEPTEPAAVDETQDGEPAETGEQPDPPVVVYEPDNDGKRRIIIIDEAEQPPKPRKPRWRREWGFNLRLQHVLMGDDETMHDDAGMGGLGFSFRYRPVPHFAFDAGLDFLGGNDYHGNERTETALLLSGIVFFNPKDKVQVYTIGGLGFSGAEVNRTHARDGSETEQEEEVEYSYFGGHLGLGLEFRVGKKTALNLDVLGFIRGRTDEKAREDPEFVDPETGRTTNTSGGGLARLGITFYW
jgi:opacity protein-like surface antigen